MSWPSKKGLNPDYSLHLDTKNSRSIHVTVYTCWLPKLLATCLFWNSEGYMEGRCCDSKTWACKLYLQTGV